MEGRENSVNFSIVCPTRLNYGLNTKWVLFHMAAKEKAKTEESQPQKELRQENRKEWSTIEPKLIEMAHKLEDSKLIESKDYV
jgi:hypothetical protein